MDKTTVFIYYHKQIEALGLKLRLVIIDEHTFGIISPLMPTVAQVIVTHPTKGSPYTVDPGSISITYRDVRTATIQDFKNFRVDPAPYFRDKNAYEFLP